MDECCANFWLSVNCFIGLFLGGAGDKTPVCDGATGGFVNVTGGVFQNLVFVKWDFWCAVVVWGKRTHRSAVGVHGL